MFKHIIFLVCWFFSCAIASDTEFRESPSFKALESELSKIKTLKGLVVQNVDGEYYDMKFTLKLPSKLKIEFVNLPVVTIINPDVMTYYDKKLDQKSQVKTPTNIASLLFTNKISLLDPRIKIKSFTENAKEIVIDFNHISNPLANFKMVFAKMENSFQVKTIEVKEGVQSVKIEFKTLTINEEVPNSEFQILTKKLDAKFNF